MKKHLLRVAIDTLFAWVAALGLIAMFSALGLLDDTLSLTWMVASFGASITLLVASPTAKLCKPYPSLVGNTASAAIGVACYLTLGAHPAIAMIVTLTLAIFVMGLLNAYHPPGGATALLALFGGPAIHSLGWLFPFVPIAAGTALLLLIAQLRRAVIQRFANNTTRTTAQNNDDPVASVSIFSANVPR